MDSIWSLTRMAFSLPEPALRAFAGRAPRSDDGTPLDPALGALLAFAARAGFPPMHTLEVPKARLQFLDDCALIGTPPDRMTSVEDRFIPGPGTPIRIRIYRPTPPSRTGELSPLLVYFHGGGWVVGDLDSHDTVCRRIARISEAVVIAVDYRRSPENRYPAAVDDVEAAYLWIRERAKQLGCDPARIGVGGDSAGGNLSAVLCRRLRDSGAPPPKAQILIYPGTDMTMSLDSHRRYAKGFFLEQEMINWFRGHYLGDMSRAAEIDASPLFAKDLSGLPPAVLVTAGFDPLRDEGHAYADKLDDAGVDVRFRCEEALVHGFISMGGVSKLCDAAVGRLARDVATML